MVTFFIILIKSRGFFEIIGVVYNQKELFFKQITELFILLRHSLHSTLLKAWVAKLMKIQ